MEPTKLVIFDLDGVLVESRDMHYDTLNDALRNSGFMPIPYEIHLSTYDGRPTRQKLEMLNIPEGAREQVWRHKQDATLKRLAGLRSDPVLIQMFKELRRHNVVIAVVSNATAETTFTALSKLGLVAFVSFIETPTDGLQPKPKPGMYWSVMGKAGATAATTVIIEDSHIGRQGAIDSGARLIPVEGPDELNLGVILEAFVRRPAPIAWRQGKLRVLIPMAGHGSRFADAGYTFPKPLVEVNGKPMIQVVVENLNIENAKYIFIVRKEHAEKYQLKYMLNMIAPGCEMIVTDEVQQGAACTTLLAKHLINDDGPLLIANSDQYMDWDANATLYAFNAHGVDGGIVTFDSIHPKWSYVSLDYSGFAQEVAEKRVISRHATTGVYFWARGRNYVNAAEKMIEKDIRTNGEFYVAPTFNQAIAWGALVRIRNCKAMWGLGTPEDLKAFLSAHKE